MTLMYPMPSSSEQESAELGTDSNVGILISDAIDAVISGKALKDTYGISDQMMEAMYAHAYDFFKKGKLEEADIIFQFLYTYDSHNPTYIMGFAAIHQQKKEYAKAAELYDLCYKLDNTRILTRLYAGQCYLFLRNQEQAKLCFTTCLNSDAPEAIKKQANAYLKALQPVKEVGVAHERN